MQLSTLKTIRTGFPILCPGTSDPFKNKTELRSFDYFTPVFLFLIILVKQKYAKRNFLKLPLKIIAIGFPILCPGTSDPFKNRIKLSSCAAHVLVKFRAMAINLANKIFKHPAYKQISLLKVAYFTN